MKLVHLSALILAAPLAAQTTVSDGGRRSASDLENAHDGPPPPWHVRTGKDVDDTTVGSAERRAGFDATGGAAPGPIPPEKVDAPLHFTLEKGARRSGVGLEDEGPIIIIDRGPIVDSAQASGLLGEKKAFDGAKLLTGVQEEMLNLKEGARRGGIGAGDLQPLYDMVKSDMRDSRGMENAKAELASAVRVFEARTRRAPVDAGDVDAFGERLIDIVLDNGLKAWELGEVGGSFSVDLALGARRGAAGGDPLADDEHANLIVLVEQAAARRAVDLDAVRVELAKSRLRRQAQTLSQHAGPIPPEEKFQVAVERARWRRTIQIGK